MTRHLVVAAEQSVRDAATEYGAAQAEHKWHRLRCAACWWTTRYGSSIGQPCQTEQRLARIAAGAQERWAAVMGRSESLPQPSPTRVEGT